MLITLAALLRLLSRTVIPMTARAGGFFNLIIMLQYIAMPGLIKSFHLPNNEQHRKWYIVDAVCQYYKMERTELLAKCRAYKYVTPRRIMYFLLHVDAGLGCVAISQMFEQHHSSVIYHVRIAKRELTFLEATKMAIKTIRSLYP